MKTKFFNLIILDESGSMSCITEQTIAGCNETINTIKAADKRLCEEQEHYISVYAFQSGGAPSRYIMKNVPAAEVGHITGKDYDPCGCTPLNDAIGATVTDLRRRVKKEKMAVGSVTIITDGMENSSHEWTVAQVVRLIEDLKEEGWNFNFIGANIDVVKTARAYHIDNHMAFEQSKEDTRRMWATEGASRQAYYNRVSCLMCAEPDMDSLDEETQQKRRRSILSDANRDFYQNENRDD